MGWLGVIAGAADWALYLNNGVTFGEEPGI